MNLKLKNKTRGLILSEEWMGWSGKRWGASEDGRVSELGLFYRARLISK